MRAGHRPAHHDSCMPLWASSVAIPILVSVAGTITTQLTVGPRLAARGKRIQAAHDSRDRFNDAILNILALTTNLESTAIPPETDEPTRSRLQDERNRWLAQIDETTAWLADHWQHIALGYTGLLNVRDLVVRYLGAARGLWLSGRPLDDRVRMLRELTEPVQTIFFARRWRVVTSLTSERTRLTTLLDTLDSAPPRDQLDVKGDSSPPEA
jgi:hypothetical protein